MFFLQGVVSSNLYCYCWTPALSEVSYKFGSVRPFFHPFVCSYWFFACMKLGSHKVREVTDSNFEGQLSREPKKVSKMVQKWGFWIFDKSLIHSNVLFLLQCESNNGLLGFCKKHISGKKLFLELWSKTSWPIRIQDSLNYKNSQTSWGMKPSFCAWLVIRRSNSSKCSESIQVSVVRLAWACPEGWQIVSQLYL